MVAYKLYRPDRESILCSSQTKPFNSSGLVCFWFGFLEGEKQKQNTQQIIFLDLQISNHLKGRFHQTKISLWLITLGTHLTSGEYLNRILILSDFTLK